jgi:PhnB protein
MSFTYSSVAPAIAVRDAARAIDFYKDAFGAEERYRLIDPESGKIGHAELTIHGGLLMISDEYPQYNKAPETLGGVSAKFLIMCPNVDLAFARAIAAGAEEVMPLADQFYGHRDARVRDPFGHEWLLSQVLEEVAPGEMQRRWNATVQKAG